MATIDLILVKEQLEGSGPAVSIKALGASNKSDKQAISISTLRVDAERGVIIGGSGKGGSVYMNVNDFLQKVEAALTPHSEEETTIKSEGPKSGTIDVLTQVTCKWIEELRTHKHYERKDYSRLFELVGRSTTTVPSTVASTVASFFGSNNTRDQKEEHADSVDLSTPLRADLWIRPSPHASRSTKMSHQLFFAGTGPKDGAGVGRKLAAFDYQDSDFDGLCCSLASFLLDHEYVAWAVLADETREWMRRAFDHQGDGDKLLEKLRASARKKSPTGLSRNGSSDASRSDAHKCKDQKVRAYSDTHKHMISLAARIDPLGPDQELKSRLTTTSPPAIDKGVATKTHESLSGSNGHGSRRTHGANGDSRDGRQQSLTGERAASITTGEECKGGEDGVLYPIGSKEWVHTQAGALYRLIRVEAEQLKKDAADAREEGNTLAHTYHTFAMIPFTSGQTCCQAVKEGAFDDLISHRISYHMTWELSAADGKSHQDQNSITCRANPRGPGWRGRTRWPHSESIRNAILRSDTQRIEAGRLAPDIHAQAAAMYFVVEQILFAQACYQRSQTATARPQSYNITLTNTYTAETFAAALDAIRGRGEFFNLLLEAHPALEELGCPSVQILDPRGNPLLNIRGIPKGGPIQHVIDEEGNTKRSGATKRAQGSGTPVVPGGLNLADGGASLTSGEEENAEIMLGGEALTPSAESSGLVQEF